MRIPGILCALVFSPSLLPAMAVAIAPPTTTTTIPSESRYGILAGPGRRHLNGRDDRPDAYAKIKAAGVEWVSILLRWDQIELQDPDAPSSSPPNWNGELKPEDPCQQAFCPKNASGRRECLGADGLIDEAWAAGLSIHVKVWGTPAWAKEGDCDHGAQCPPRDDVVFGRFMRKLVARYKYKVSSWGLWVEPDNADATGDGGGWSGSKQKFRDRILKPGFDAVKAVTGNAVGTARLVASPQFLMEPPSVLDDWLKENGRFVRDFDVIGVSIIETDFADWKAAVDAYDEWARHQCDLHLGCRLIWILAGGCAPVCRCAGCQIQCGCERHQTRNSLAYLCDKPYIRRIFWSRLHDATGGCNCPGDIRCQLGFLDSDGNPRSKYNELKGFIVDDGGCEQDRGNR